MKEFQKEEIERHLLAAMSQIDQANAVIIRNGTADNYDDHLELQECNRKIKKILNDKYDNLARRKKVLAEWKPKKVQP